MTGERKLMQLGEKQLLKVVKKVEFGVYLGEEDSEERESCFR